MKNNLFGKAAGLMLMCASFLGVIGILIFILNMFGNPWDIVGEAGDMEFTEILFELAISTPIAILLAVASFKYWKFGKFKKIAIIVLSIFIGFATFDLLFMNNVKSIKFDRTLWIAFWGITLAMLVLSKEVENEYPNITFTKEDFIGSIIASAIIAIFAIVSIINIQANSFWLTQADVDAVNIFNLESDFPPEVGYLGYKSLYPIMIFMVDKTGFLISSILSIGYAMWNLSSETSFVAIKKQDVREVNENKLYGTVFAIGLALSAVSLLLLLFTPVFHTAGSVYTSGFSIIVSRKVSKWALIIWTLLSLVGAGIMIGAGTLRANTYFEKVEGYEMEKNQLVEVEEDKPVKATKKKAPVSKAETTIAVASKPAPAPKVVAVQPEAEYEEVLYVKKAMIGGIIGVIAGAMTLLMAEIFLIGSFNWLVHEGLEELVHYTIVVILIFAPNILAFVFSLITVINGRFRIVAASFVVISCVTSFLLTLVWPPRLLLFVLFLISSIFLFMNK